MFFLWRYVDLYITVLYNIDTQQVFVLNTTDYESHREVFVWIRFIF